MAGAQKGSYFNFDIWGHMTTYFEALGALINMLAFLNSVSRYIGVKLQFTINLPLLMFATVI